MLKANGFGTFFFNQCFVTQQCNTTTTTSAAYHFEQALNKSNLKAPLPH